MAVEYEISSDVATVKEVAPNTQVASVVKFYTGSVTYDDEPTSKYASVTISGKTQRVMLCVAVSGTVVYDDVPCLYSTVDGHRTLNVVEPTESGTPDDVPSLYETVVVDGKTVRALRCVLINATPVYDGVSSTCTFVDNGKTHTAQLINQVGAGYIDEIVHGTSPLSLPDAVANSLSYVKAFGGTEQGGVPTGYKALNGITNGSGTYVDTGITPAVDDVEIEIRVKPTTGSWYILQSRQSGGPIWGVSGSSSGSKILLGWAGTGNLCQSAIVRDTTHTYYIKATLNNGTATLYVKDETSNTDDTQTNTYTSAVPTLPFWLYGNQNTDRVAAGNTVYMARVKVGGVTVMDYVPALNPSNVVGFYDKTTGNFKVSNEGTLTADQTIVPTPTAPIDIVCNNGVLKVKDSELPVGYKRLTGITYDSNTYYETNEKLYGSDTLTITLSGTSSNGRNVIGAYSGTGDDVRNFSLFIYGAGSTSNSYLRHGTQLGRPRYGTGARTLVMSPTGTDGFLTDVTYDAETFETTDTFWIGALPNSTSTKYDGNIIGNITVSNRLKYIPCERVSDGKIGYYETFTGVFLEPQGNGTPVSMGYDTSYMTEVYVDGTVETIEDTLGNSATCEPLLAVGDYTDVQSIIDGVVTRNVGVKVLTGEEAWNLAGSGDALRVDIRTDIGLPPTQDLTSPMICTHYPFDAYFSTGGSTQPGTFNAWNGEEGYFLRFSIVGMNITTVAQWKNWLAAQAAAGTPVIVIYPLAEPTTESVAGQTLQVEEGSNTIEITQASISGLELEAKYKKTSE